MQTLRLNFSKTGDAKYVSHLDLNRCFTRAIRQSGVDAWYTEGFHSHLYLLFALPLALGIESVCESLDIKLNKIGEDIDVSDRINPYLPKGIEVFNSFFPKHKQKEIACARYFIKIADESEYLEEIESVCGQLLSQEAIPVEKKGKKGVSTVDIKQQIHEIECRVNAKYLSIDLLADAGNTTNLNPTMLLNEIFKRLEREPESSRITRMQILTGERENFE